MGEDIKPMVKAKLDLIDENTLIAGIDIGKRKHYLRFINLRGYELGKVITFVNTRDGMEKIGSEIEKVKKQNNLAKAVIGLESLGHYWKAAAHCLSTEIYRLTLVNPYYIKKTKEIDDNSQTKSDREALFLLQSL